MVDRDGGSVWVIIIFSVILHGIHLSDYALPQVPRRQILCIGTQKASFLFFPINYGLKEENKADSAVAHFHSEFFHPPKI
jgi:hypothetical protein